ncbi:exonuclease VII large subunit [Spinactinospora alkalitolerans]|uniref:Exonuclease VII large subunit n=1 Tax=Spinactinospora alkalitolerans TaxID=687207 RepID=A0A852U3G1_9ACTN|nr:DUF4041 domain-containing protein [Spinactinospora alkalitolerans]NYE50035.1 exonuclease VII large subunit [Spinactinospora alkalitolerans]
MSTIKHQEGEAILSADSLTLTFTAWTAMPAKKQASPLIIPLTGIVCIEQQLTRLNERYLRIVTPGYTPNRKVAEDPHVLHFQPVRSGYAAEVAAFVEKLVAAVNTYRAGGPATPPGCLVEVEDIKSTAAPRTPAEHVPGGHSSAGVQPMGNTAVAGYRYNSPPNWPAPPPGWTPPPDWRPDPAWGPAPVGWPFWVPAEPPQPSPAAPPPAAHEQPPTHPAIAAPSNAGPPQSVPPDGHVDTDIGVFGARSKARELAVQVNRLTDDNVRLRADLERLGALEAAELEQAKQRLKDDIAALEAEERAQRDQAAAAHRAAASQAAAEIARLQSRMAELRRGIVVTEDLLVLQEAGVYEYAHPLDDSVAYKAALAELKDHIKAMNRKDGGAVQATTAFTMNGSLTEGRKMVGEFSKLLLRAYNNEADNLVRGMKPYKLSTARDRLDKTRATVEKLGRSMDIRISHPYHRLRLRELELTADHLNKVAEEKEREREEKARLREERQAQAELEREKARLDKERRHYENALAALRDKGDEEGARRLQDQIDDIAKAMDDVDQRAANVRAGYVYVISNLGSFGERMIKVGMTRRLDPMDRVRELSDASVPFNFDVHALHFSDDAVGVEAEMHRRLADRRVNRVNHRREFFRATPAEVRDLLASVAGDLLQYDETPEAAEYRQSITEADAPEQAPAAASGGGTAS